MVRTELPYPGIAAPGVVWITGEQDLANVRELAAALARAAAVADADLVVDLSGVEFMDASTVGVILRLRNLRAAQSAPFCVRAPSPVATRVLSACGLLELVQGAPEPAIVGGR